MEKMFEIVFCVESVEPLVVPVEALPSPASLHPTPLPVAKTVRYIITTDALWRCPGVVAQVPAAETALPGAKITVATGAGGQWTFARGQNPRWLLERVSIPGVPGVRLAKLLPYFRVQQPAAIVHSPFPTRSRGGAGEEQEEGASRPKGVPQEGESDATPVGVGSDA
jgi:hypothetical protein